MATTYRIEMTTRAGDRVLVGCSYDHRAEAEAARLALRDQGAFTDGRDVWGDLCAPNVTRVIEVQS